MNTSTASSDSNTYFDLHTTGVGYLNRIRTVTPKKGDAFLACDIAALTGPSNKPDYRYFDVRVSGTDAQHLVKRCEESVTAKKKVLIGFRIGDLWTDIFTYQSGKKAGTQGVSLKARLLFISWIKVDGALVYKAEPRSADDSSQPAALPSSLESVDPVAPAPESTSANDPAPAVACAVSSF